MNRPLTLLPPPRAGRLCALAGTALALAACSVPTAAPDAARSRELGVLQLVSSAPLGAALPRSDAEEWTPSLDDARYIVVPREVVDVPDTVRSGRTLTVTVHTIGTDGCWSADGGTLERSADTITIRPYDRHSGAAACTAIALVGGLEHRFVTRFDEPGTSVIRVQGRRVRQDVREEGTPVTVERRVVVIP
jgi:hypothetical protein